jgi:hypothetical protein
MRLLLVGHGRMGKLVETLAPEYDATVAAVVSRQWPLLSALAMPILRFAMATSVPWTSPLISPSLTLSSRIFHCWRIAR